MVFWYLHGRHDEDHEKEKSLDSERGYYQASKETEAGTAVRRDRATNESIYCEHHYAERQGRCFLSLWGRLAANETLSR